MLNSFIKRQIGRKFKGSHKILYFSEDVNFNRQLLVSSFWTLQACNSSSSQRKLKIYNNNFEQFSSRQRLIILGNIKTRVRKGVRTTSNKFGQVWGNKFHSLQARNKWTVPIVYKGWDQRQMKILSFKKCCWTIFFSLIFFEICLDLAQIEEAKGQQQN